MAHAVEHSELTGRQARIGSFDDQRRSTWDKLSGAIAARDKQAPLELAEFALDGECRFIFELLIGWADALRRLLGERGVPERKLHAHTERLAQAVGWIRFASIPEQGGRRTGLPRGMACPSSCLFVAPRSCAEPASEALAPPVSFKQERQRQTAVSPPLRSAIAVAPMLGPPATAAARLAAFRLRLACNVLPRGVAERDTTRVPPRGNPCFPATSRKRLMGLEPTSFCMASTWSSDERGLDIPRLGKRYHGDRGRSQARDSTPREGPGVH